MHRKRACLFVCMRVCRRGYTVYMYTDVADQLQVEAIYLRMSHGDAYGNALQLAAPRRPWARELSAQLWPRERLPLPLGRDREGAISRVAGRAARAAHRTFRVRTRYLRRVASFWVRPAARSAWHGGSPGTTVPPPLHVQRATWKSLMQLISDIRCSSVIDAYGSCPILCNPRLV